MKQILQYRKLYVSDILIIWWILHDAYKGQGHALLIKVSHVLQLGHAEGEMVLDMFLQWHWKDYVAWIIDCANYDELIIIRKLRISDCVSYEYLIVPIMNNFVHYE